MSLTEQKQINYVDIDNFDINKLEFIPVDPNKQKLQEQSGKNQVAVTQLSIFARYDKRSFEICVTIDDFKGGQTSNVDRNQREMFPLESPNVKFNVGLDPTNEKCKKLKQVVLQIEEKLQNNLQKLIGNYLSVNGKKFTGYELFSDIKKAKVASKEDPDVKIEVEDTPEHFSKLILKYDEDFNTKKIKTIFTTNELDEKRSLDEGRRVYKTLESKTRTDISQIKLYHKKIRLSFNLTRCWVQKQTSPMCHGKKGYGVTFKLTRVHICNSNNLNNVDAEYSNFFNDEEETEENNKFNELIKKMNNENDKNNKNKEENTDDEEVIYTDEKEENEEKNEEKNKNDNEKEESSENIDDIMENDIDINDFLEKKSNNGIKINDMFKNNNKEINKKIKKTKKTEK